MEIADWMVVKEVGRYVASERESLRVVTDRVEWVGRYLPEV